MKRKYVKKQITGTIKDWQVHTLSFTKKDINKVYPGENLKPLIISGTVVKDNKGRWKPGYHMRSSLLIKLDRKDGHAYAYTRNSVYKLIGKENNDVLPNLGNDILNIFY